MGQWRLNSPATRLFTQPFIQAQIKENIKALRHWPLCGNSPGTGKFPAQMASKAENVSIWWRHHDVGPVLKFAATQRSSTRPTTNQSSQQLPRRAALAGRVCLTPGKRLQPGRQNCFGSYYITVQYTRAVVCLTTNHCSQQRIMANPYTLSMSVFIYHYRGSP